MTSTAPKKHIDELHFEHKLWTSKMRFYMDELSIFENHLSELVQRNTQLSIFRINLFVKEKLLSS